MEQDFLTITEHLSSPPGFSGVRVAQHLGCRLVFCTSVFALFLSAIVFSVFFTFVSGIRLLPPIKLTTMIQYGIFDSGLKHALPNHFHYLASFKETKPNCPPKKNKLPISICDSFFYKSTKWNQNKLICLRHHISLVETSLSSRLSLHCAHTAEMCGKHIKGIR